MPRAVSTESGTAAVAPRQDGRFAVRQFLRVPGFCRLLSIRLCGQFADGVFQASLAGTVLFNPERQAHAAEVAAGFAILLLPYSVLGPFCGVLLDRWSRQRVLIGANLLRALLVCLVALEIAVGISGTLFYASALAMVSCNRFVLSCLSASLPHTVPVQRLVSANAVSTTCGALVASVGGGSAIALRMMSGGSGGFALVAIGAALGYLAAAVRATGFGRHDLGPDAQTRQGCVSSRHVLAGLIAGAGHIREHPAVLRAFGVIAIQRFAYGITAITTLLLYRNYFSGDGLFRAGLTGLGQLVAATALGGALAAACTPAAVRRLGLVRWPAFLLISAGLIEPILGLPFAKQTFLPAAALLGFAAQGVKICVDTLVAQQVSDEFRGRVFTLYDTLFNLVFVAAGVATAIMLPENGKSAVAVCAIGVAYLSIGLLYLATSDRGPVRAPTPPLASQKPAEPLPDSLADSVAGSRSVAIPVGPGCAAACDPGELHLADVRIVRSTTA